MDVKKIAWAWRKGVLFFVLGSFHPLWVAKIQLKGLAFSTDDAIYFEFYTQRL